MPPDLPPLLSPVLSEARAEISARLRGEGIESHALDARLLLMHVLGASHEALIADPQRPLSPAETDRLASALQRRLQHEPVSRIIGSREFYGREFVLRHETLDPRPDTETVVERALAAHQHLKNPCGRILDIGTGSGAIALTLLAELPAVMAVATDISAGALEVARKNAQRMGLAERIEFVNTDWADAVEGQFDIVVSNPPYIPTGQLAGLPAEVRNYDPRIALDGGMDGLRAYEHVAAAARRVLRPGGFVILETGFDQTAAVAGMFLAAGFEPHRAVSVEKCDLAGNPRVVSLVRGA